MSASSTACLRRGSRKTPWLTARLTSSLTSRFTPWCFKGAHPPLKDVSGRHETIKGAGKLQTFQRKYLADTMNKNEVQRALDVLDHPLWKHRRLAQVRQWPTVKPFRLFLRELSAQHGDREPMWPPFWSLTGGVPKRLSKILKWKEPSDWWRVQKL